MCTEVRNSFAHTNELILQGGSTIKSYTVKKQTRYHYLRQGVVTHIGVNGHDIVLAVFV